MRAEYLLAMPPSSSVENVVLDLKNELYHKTGSYPARNSRPHISILWVLMDDSLESKILDSLQNVIAQERPISMTTSGIRYFVSSQTIYVGIKEINLFSTMSRNINRNSIFSSFSSKFKCSTYVPHLTIGRSLNGNFEIARNYFGEYSYEESFTATSAILLKRYDSSKYFPVKEFPFCSTPSSQLSLF